MEGKELRNRLENDFLFFVQYMNTNFCDQMLKHYSKSPYNISISSDCETTVTNPTPMVGTHLDRVIMDAVKVKVKKGKKKMYYDDDDCCNSTLTADERKTNFLVNELDIAVNKKRADAYTHFNMDGTPAPTSPKEFVEMVQQGKFQFTKNHLNDDGSWRDENNHPYNWAYNIFSYLKPADPAKEPKREEFKAAEKLLDKAYLDAEREIRIAAPADGLKTLKDFEAKTFN